MPNRKRLRRNMAKVEFRACMELAESLLAQGFNKRLAYERLTEQGHITMSYFTFCKLVLKASRNALHVMSLRPVSAVRQTAASPPIKPQSKIITAQSDKLQDPRTIDTKTLF